MSLQEYLNNKNITKMENGSFQLLDQINDLKNIIGQSNIKSVMEIGFNAGHSADLFLKTNPNIDLVSFDIGMHNYVGHAKQFIDNTYPMRHTLIIGDSRCTVPKYKADHPSKSFDVIFIDGAHEYEFSKADFDNCRKLAHKDTIVIMDDTFFSQNGVANWNIGPNKVWIDALQEGSLKCIGSSNYQLGRGMSWGIYMGV